MGFLSGAKAIGPEKVEKDDIIIAIMGPTGSGKSNLIEKIVGDGVKRAGDSLGSQTAKVQATRITYKGGKLVVVDTPGFDDTNKSDMEILSMINAWLEKTYRKGVKLSGILYLHRITDNRMTGAAHKNLRMFGELCGDAAAQRVIMVTTMWDSKRADPTIAEKREKELMETLWKTMIEHKSSCARFYNTQDSALGIVDMIIQKEKERETLLLQEEVVEIGKQLNETQAGKALYTTLQKLLSEQRETVRLLSEQAAKQDNPMLKKQLDEELDRIQQEFQSTFNIAKSMKISWTRKFVLCFLRKANSNPLHLG